MDDLSKACHRCGKVKALIDFGKYSKTKDRLHYNCRQCVGAESKAQYAKHREARLAGTRAWKRANEEKHKAGMKRWRAANKANELEKKRKKWYGISGEEYTAMLAAQDGCCVICGRHHTEFKYAMSVDHCHKTKKIRGILCKHCNLGIGQLGDDADRISRAAEYLRKSTGG